MSLHLLRPACHHARVSACALGVKQVLDDDAEVFVAKLWRMLAFHATRLRELEAR